MTKLSTRTQITDSDLTDDCIVHIAKPGSPYSSHKATIEQLKNVFVLTKKIHLTSSQLNNGNSSPINVISCPTGYFIEVTHALMNYSANNGLRVDDLNLFLTTFAAVDPSSPGTNAQCILSYGDPANSAFINWQEFQNQRDCINPGNDLYIYTNIDTMLGDGNVDCYITYQIKSL